MPKIILFNKFRPSEHVGALVLVWEHKPQHKVELPDVDKILENMHPEIQISKPAENDFLFGYFKDSIETFEVLNIFKQDFWDWHWIDLEKFYEAPLEYINKCWWDEMDKTDFLIFIKNKNEILEQFDRIKTS